MSEEECTGGLSLLSGGFNWAIQNGVRYAIVDFRLHLPGRKSKLRGFAGLAGFGLGGGHERSRYR